MVSEPIKVSSTFLKVARFLGAEPLSRRRPSNTSITTPFGHSPRRQSSAGAGPITFLINFGKALDNPPSLDYNNPQTCGRSSSGRAPPCQGGGSEFEPRRPLQRGAPAGRTRTHSVWVRVLFVRGRRRPSQGARAPPHNSPFPSLPQKQRGPCGFLFLHAGAFLVSARPFSRSRGA